MNSPIDITNVMLFLLSQPISGAAASAITQFLKKTFHMDSEHVIHAVAVLISLLAALVAYYLKFRGLPLAVLGISGPASYGFSQGLYKLCKLLAAVLPIISPILAKLSSLLNKRTPV